MIVRAIFYLEFDLADDTAVEATIANILQEHVDHLTSATGVPRIGGKGPLTWITSLKHPGMAVQ